MHTIKDNVTIMIKPSVSLFAKAGKNSEFVKTLAPKLGASHGSVTTMLDNAEALKLVMSRVINVSETSNEWETKVVKYLSCITVPIPFTGKTLDISLNFNTANAKRIDHIKKLRVDSGQKLETDEELGKYCMANVATDAKKGGLINPYNILFYGEPVTAEDYVLYLHCLGYSHVANTFADVDNSPNIRFYLYKESDMQKQKAALAQLRTKAVSLFNEVVAKTETLTKAYNVIMRDDILTNTFSNVEDVAGMIIYLSTLMGDNPEVLYETLKDKKYLKTGTVLELIKQKVFTVKPNTQIIMDNVGKEIGINLDKATEHFYSLSESEQANILALIKK